jgi:hypothetical protein
MIKLIKWIRNSFKANQRKKTDRRVNHIQADISDTLAESSGNDFPLLKKRENSRRVKREALCY